MGPDGRRLRECGASPEGGRFPRRRRRGQPLVPERRSPRPCVRARAGDVARAYPGAVIIGTGGVSTGEDAVEMLLAGASAVGVGTATFRDPRATLRIVAELEDWCARHDVARVRDLIGGIRE